MANGTSGTNGAGAAPAPPQEKPVNNLPPIGEQPLGMNKDGAKEWVKNNTNVDPAKVTETFDAVRHFTGSGSSAIRHAQKNGNTSTAAGIEGVLTEEYIKAAPQWDNSRDLHRGMSLSKDEVKKIINTQGTNKTIDINNSGTASWSTKYKSSESFAYAYGDDVPVMFRTKSMKNATPVMHISLHQQEMEVLSSKDNRFKVKKVSHKKINGKNGYLIDVEQV